MVFRKNNIMNRTIWDINEWEALGTSLSVLFDFLFIYLFTFHSVDWLIFHLAIIFIWFTLHKRITTLEFSTLKLASI